MKSEFNPTRKDLLLVEKLILDIKGNRDNLISTKISLQNQLSDLKKKYFEVKFKTPEFEEIKYKRQSVKEQLTRVELKIKGAKDELNFKNKLKLEVEFYLKNNKSLEGREDLDKIQMKISSLTKKYKNFAKDRTRISSLRVMASEVVCELEQLI